MSGMILMDQVGTEAVRVAHNLVALSHRVAHIFFYLPRRYFYYLQIARRTPLRFAQAKAPMLKGLL